MGFGGAEALYHLYKGYVLPDKQLYWWHNIHTFKARTWVNA